MMSKEQTVAGYIKSLEPERRAAISKVREVVRKNLPKGFEEGMQFGMIGYYVPLKRFPDTYNKQPLLIAGLASQKNFMALYLLGVYGDAKLDKWFRAEFKKAGKKLDMGKSCLHFKSLDALPLPLIGEVITKVSVDDLIATHQAIRTPSARAKRTRTRKT
jgi:hypothetical protein